MSNDKKMVGRGGEGPQPPALTKNSPKPSPPTPYRGLGGEFEGRAGEPLTKNPPGPPLKSPFPLRVCVPVVAETVTGARRGYLRAARKGCWTEVRLDYLKRPDLKKLFRTRPGPVIATNRLSNEGGRWSGTEEERRRLLEEALESGVNFLDVELATDAAWRRELRSRRGETGLILSWHDFSGTPEPSRLEAVMAEMLAEEAQILKLVTLAHQPEDNLRVLSLIPLARARGREIIAFCLGPLGQWSRIAAPFLGSYLTYAPFNRKGASAPGQLTVNEVKRLWRWLK